MIQNTIFISPIHCALLLFRLLAKSNLDELNKYYIIIIVQTVCDFSQFKHSLQELFV